MLGQEEEVDEKNIDVDVEEGEGSEDGEEAGTPRDDDEDEEAAKASRGRGRGRPRGRPKGSGIGRPRGRGRGRPRGKGRLTTRSRRDRDEEPIIEKEYPEDGPVRYFRRYNGEIVYIEGDEYVTGDLEKGDEKIDKDGNLLGGRQFKAQTFVLPGRHPTRRYMLAIDAARSSGFRDSLYYFRRNQMALKLNATQWEKDYLIDEGKLGTHLRTRSVTMITARSAYKLHGAKMIVNGRWIIDDYNEPKVLEEITARGLKPGDPVGDLQDTSTLAAEAAMLAGEMGSSKQERSTGASLGMYRAGGPTTLFGGSGWGPYSEGPLNAVKKSMLTRDGVHEDNWMFVAAQRTLEMGEEWKKLRRAALRANGGADVGSGGGEATKRAAPDVTGPGHAGNKRPRAGEDGPLGVYEPQTGIVLYRSDTQPTQSHWEPVDDSRPILRGTKVGSGAWGLATVDTVLQLPIPGEDERYRLDMLRMIMESS
ncbi:chromatin remodelling complex Rsc7/Swp82 subunit-domain-containing protein [Irpex rosettiformis]|uniref:Chromatin remodelling complex Rsc7/Swp82 subunit-domain-containing protein n=1 Tax=Irpex rosettiformis TaxID=378272 RepID=A0ACB8U5L7_9APHY|nr:chromatin remodelling complex Rsc7/Swp82 subunit-domain-containing protein [Irpex rosettiformis]